MARPFRRSSSSSSFGPRGRLLSRRRVGGVIWPAPINKTFAAVTAGRSADTRRVTRVSCLHTLSVYTCFQFVATEIRDDRRPLLAIVLQLNRHAPRSTVNDANRLRGHGEFLVIYRARWISNRSLRVAYSCYRHYVANCGEHFARILGTIGCSVESLKRKQLWRHLVF